MQQIDVPAVGRSSARQACCEQGDVVRGLESVEGYSDCHTEFGCDVLMGGCVCVSEEL